MRFKERVPDVLIKENHYLGRPADFDDKIVERRIRLLKLNSEFCNKELELLDIGCGNGSSMFLLSDQMKNCFGIDLEESHKEEFEAFKKDNRIANCEFNIFDIEKQSLDRQFDRIISFEVIEHLNDDKNVKFFFETLKEDGLIAVTVPNKWWIFETHGARLPILPWNRVPFFSWLPKSIHDKFANARIYTRQSIVELLESVGFNIIVAKYITAPLDVLGEGKLKKILTKYIFHSDSTKNPFIATSIFLIAKK